MKGNARISKFLELQSKNVNIEDIAKEIGITVKTLRAFLNKNGYKLKDGKYVFNNDNSLNAGNQVSFEQIEKKEKETSKKTNLKNIEKKTESKPKLSKVKKDKKINITQDDLDKLCEVYDWYLQVKDYKSMKPKNTLSKKDIIIEEIESKELKTTSIKIDKKTWEDFERLCSNSKFNKQEIITQALKDFMKQYKHLL